LIDINYYSTLNLIYWLITLFYLSYYVSLEKIINQTLIDINYYSTLNLIYWLITLFYLSYYVSLEKIIQYGKHCISST